jgi:hypothetical protein
MDHKLAPNAAWDENAFKGPFSGNDTYHSTTKNRSILPVFKEDGTDVMYCITPGAMISLAIQRKKMLQSHFDSV